MGGVFKKRLVFLIAGLMRGHVVGSGGGRRGGGESAEGKTFR